MHRQGIEVAMAVAVVALVVVALVEVELEALWLCRIGLILMILRGWFG